MTRRLLHAIRLRLRRWAGYGWTFDVVDDDHAHIRPRRDIVLHELDEDCSCLPTPEPIFRDDGSVAWNLIHHSLDGREAGE